MLRCWNSGTIHGVAPSTSAWVSWTRRLSDAEYLRRYERERAYTVATHARGTDVGTKCLDDLRLWVRVYDDGAQLTAWMRYLEWVEYCYGSVTLQVMNPDGTWRPWAATDLAAKDPP